MFYVSRISDDFRHPGGRGSDTLPDSSAEPRCGPGRIWFLRRCFARVPAGPGEASSIPRHHPTPPPGGRGGGAVQRHSCMEGVKGGGRGKNSKVSHSMRGKRSPDSESAQNLLQKSGLGSKFGRQQLRPKQLRGSPVRVRPKLARMSCEALPGPPPPPIARGEYPRKFAQILKYQDHKLP
jgi:hypothetical protein